MRLLVRLGSQGLIARPPINHSVLSI